MDGPSGPPIDTWAAHVAQLQTRFGVPNIALPPHLQLRPLQLKRLYVAYRKIIVAPAVAEGLCCKQTTPPLQWG